MNSGAYALVVEYAGTRFHGFQIQAGQRTVQEELEKALAVFLREPVRVSCCGRTDAGVHATGQVVGFPCAQSLDSYRLMAGLNALLPADLVVHRVVNVSANFHPRFSCVAREYEYLIWNGRSPPGLWRERVWWHPRPLVVEQLNHELAAIIGQHDFKAFTRAEYRDETTIRYIDQATLHVDPDPPGATVYVPLLRFRIRGNAFLHNMIRILAGTLVDRADGKISLTLGEILKSRDRLRAGQTAPSRGLYLRTAFYGPGAGADGLEILPDYPVFRPGRGPENA